MSEHSNSSSDPTSFNANTLPTSSLADDAADRVQNMSLNQSGDRIPPQSTLVGQQPSIMAQDFRRPSFQTHAALPPHLQHFRPVVNPQGSYQHPPHLVRSGSPVLVPIANPSPDALRHGTGLRLSSALHPSSQHMQVWPSDRGNGGHLVRPPANQTGLLMRARPYYAHPPYPPMQSVHPSNNQGLSTVSDPVPGALSNGSQPIGHQPSHTLIPSQSMPHLAMAYVHGQPRSFPLQGQPHAQVLPPGALPPQQLAHVRPLNDDANPQHQIYWEPRPSFRSHPMPHLQQPSPRPYLPYPSSSSSDHNLTTKGNNVEPIVASTLNSVNDPSYQNGVSENTHLSDSHQQMDPVLSSPHHNSDSPKTDSSSPFPTSSTSQSTSFPHAVYSDASASMAMGASRESVLSVDSSAGAIQGNQTSIDNTLSYSAQDQSHSGPSKYAYHKKQHSFPSPGVYWNPIHAIKSQARNDSDNTSIQSNATSQPSLNTVDKTVSAPGNESLETMRQNAKRSKDPHTYLTFAKHLIKISEGLPQKLAHLSPKRIRKNQDVLNQEALKWLSESAKSSFGKLGLPEALFILADCYGSGALGLAIDHDKAFSNYSQAAKQNHPAATYRVAVSFEVGAGTRRNTDRAIEYYRRAAKLGDTAAMFKLGMIQIYGTLGQQQNPREGVTLLKRAAEQADETSPNALHELAILYEGEIPGITNVIIPDPAYSHELLTQSAKLGYAPSQYKLGLCHEYGNLGVPIDPRRSIAWYTKAAEQGDPDAELALSGWYLTGADGILKQSDQEAYLWARKAADKGLAKAEYAVGYFVEHGVGIRSDMDEARKWYMRSAGQGNKRAIQRLKDFVVRNQQDANKSIVRNFRKTADSSDCSVM
ncbi:hypothetical protein BDV3_004020 [Batrachochytrium dendrobatidis]